METYHHLLSVNELLPFKVETLYFIHILFTKDLSQLSQFKNTNLRWSLRLFSHNVVNYILFDSMPVKPKLWVTTYANFLHFIFTFRTLLIA